MLTASWQPVLDGALGAQALEAADAVAQSLRDGAQAESGRVEVPADLAVLHAYVARALDSQVAAEAAEALLDEALEAVASDRMRPALFGGFTGVAWALEHVQALLFDPQDEDLDEAVDEALLQHLGSSPWLAEYDLISGLVGFGVYALERLPRPSALRCLELVVERLAETAETGPGGITWHTPPELLPSWQRELCPAGYYNLGVAHGVPGVIAMLGQACASGVAPAKTRPLLDGAVRWLLGQKLPEAAGSFYSNWAGPGVQQKESRLAWCYGDLGLAAALLAAARGAGEPGWEQEALAIARRAALRPAEGSGVIDAALCHGAAGVGHVFNRMFQATGDPVLGGAARFWLEKTLQMRQPGQGVAGFLARATDSDGNIVWKADPGLLGGASGIALALLAATTGVEPLWDRVLLTAIPAQGSPK